MTTSRYILARTAQAFGITRRNQRLSEAAAEMHLLREAEAYLGAAVWEKVSDIERLSVEYWNLRKLAKERTENSKKIASCEERLQNAHDERATLLSANPVADPTLTDDRTALLAELEAKTRRRDQIVAKARDVRRIYEGLKMKLDVLSREATAGESHEAEIKKVKVRLDDLKTEFSKLKEERVEIGKEIEAGDAELDRIDQDLESHRRARRDKASATFQAIGEMNKELSSMRAEEGLLDTRINQLHSEIGRYVSRNFHHDRACSDASRSHRGLTEVMAALRRSVALNHKLAGTN